MPERPIGGLSSAEAAAILGVTEMAVGKLVQRGVLHKVGKGQRLASRVGVACAGPFPNRNAEW